MKHFICLALILVTNQAFSQSVGETAPDINFEHSFQGPSADSIDLSSLKGKVVVLEFWATWCAPCLAVLPHLQELESEFADGEVQFILVTDEKEELVKKFLMERKLPGWVVADTDRSVFNEYGIDGIPHAVVVDGSGTVVLRINSKYLTASSLKSIVRGGSLVPVVEEPGSAEDQVEAPRYPAPVAGFDPLAMPFIEAGLVKMDSLPYQTILRKTMDPHASSAFGTTGRGGGAGLTLVAQTPRFLAGVVGGIRKTRVLDEVGLGSDKWDFIVARPNANYDDLKIEAGKVFDEVFGVKRIKGQVEKPVLVATSASTTFKLASEIESGDPLSAAYQSLKGLIARYEVLTGKFVVVEIDNIHDLRIDTFGFDIFTTDGEALGDWLVKNGIQFTEGVRSIEVLRLVRREEGSGDGWHGQATALPMRR